MPGKKTGNSKSRGVGFVACYKGEEIASSSSIKSLAENARVKALLGDKELLIKHTVPENLVAIYMSFPAPGLPRPSA